MRKGSRHSAATRKKISDSLKKRSRISLPKTKKFHKIYGNYCGKGNQGGKPIDRIDSACKRHDMCYYSGENKRVCDRRLVNSVRKSQASGKLNGRQKIASKAISTYFNRKLKKKTK